MKEIIVPVEYFEKTDQRKELDKALMRSNSTPTGKVTLIDNIVSTYYKYMYEHATTNVKIICNEMPPQIYKVAAEEIEIINKKGVITINQDPFYNPH